MAARGGFAAQALVVGPLTLHTPCIFSAQYWRPKSKARALNLRRQASPLQDCGRLSVSLPLSHARRHERAAAREARSRAGRTEEGRRQLGASCRRPAPPSRPPLPQVRRSLHPASALPQVRSRTPRRSPLPSSSRSLASGHCWRRPLPSKPPGSSSSAPAAPASSPVVRRPAALVGLISVSTNVWIYFRFQYFNWIDLKLETLMIDLQNVHNEGAKDVAIIFHPCSACLSR